MNEGGREPDDASDEDERLSGIVAAHVNQLMEHFDSVRVFVTKDQFPGHRHVTGAYDLGGGNFYAQLGQVRDFLLRQDHTTRLHEEASFRERDVGDQG